jgi:hypothetical protein
MIARLSVFNLAVLALLALSATVRAEGSADVAALTVDNFDQTIATGGDWFVSKSAVGF